MYKSLIIKVGDLITRNDVHIPNDHFLERRVTYRIERISADNVGLKTLRHANGAFAANTEIGVPRAYLTTEYWMMD